MNWTIEPLAGLGPLRFGATRQDVARIPGLGAVTALDPSFDGSVNEFRGMDEPSCNYRDDRLVGVDTSWRVKTVLFDGLDVYSAAPRDVLKALERANGGSLIGLGMVLFTNIGVNTSGFFDESSRRYLAPSRPRQDDRGLGLFVKGAFDALLGEFSAIELP